MCVSATLLPVCMEGRLLGDLASVRDLLEVKRGRAASRSALEKYAILQPWSFPRGPDFLTPPKDHYFGAPNPYPPDYDQGRDGWYKDLVDVREREYWDEHDRETNYYGTWLYVEEMIGEDLQNPPGLHQRHLTSEKDVFLDDCLAGMTMMHKRLLERNVPGPKEVFDLGAAYAKYLHAFNQHNRKYFNERSGELVLDGPLRTVTPPIRRLTLDAAWVLEQTRKWLEEPTAVLCDNPVQAKGAQLYPMLITAPDWLQSRHMEWVTTLFKLAWLRMHEDYLINHEGMRDFNEQAIVSTYGVTVLVHQSDKNACANIARADDIDEASLQNPQNKVVEIGRAHV